MYFINLAFVILFFCFHGIKCDCDSRNGPEGSYECKLFEPQYTQYQWAYCKTDKYIKIKSKARHKCSDTSATYCFYQCNLEVNNDGGSGEVSTNCKCDPNTDISTLQQLPVDCLNPDGSDCNWYIDCLEERYTCKADGDISYATDYALKYCNLYTDNYSWFSDTGQQWIDAVRKCLQVQLVSLLYPTYTATCQEIRDTAIDSHHGCYFDPGDDAPSFCDISFADWGKVFWTIKGSVHNSDNWIPLLTSLAKLPQECPRQAAEIAIVLVPIMKIGTVAKLARQLLGKRSIDETYFNLNDHVIQVSKLLSSQMKWNEKGVAWFAYIEDGSVQVFNISHSSMSIVLMLAPKAEYDLNADPSTVSVNITEALSDFEYSLQNGEISIPSASGLEITNISFCNDMACSSTGPDIEIKFSEVKPTANLKYFETSNLFIILIACGSVFGVFLLVAALIAFVKLRKCNGDKVV